MENPPESFTGFSSLPLSLKVLQRGDLILPQDEDLTGFPTISAGLLDKQPLPNPPLPLVNGQIPLSEGRLRIASEDNMFLNFNQFAYAFFDLNQDGERGGAR